MVMFEEGAKRRKRARWEFNSRFLQLCWAVSLEAIQPCQEAQARALQEMRQVEVRQLCERGAHKL